MSQWSMPAWPIKVSQNGRYFVDQEGVPFFWLGDTAWPLLVEYQPEQALAYLRNRGERGFTVIQCVVAWGGGTGYENDRPSANPHGEQIWIDDDPAQPNPAYFEHIEWLLAQAAEQGLILAILPTWGYQVNDIQRLNTANAYAYGRWLGERFAGAPNLIWVNGGDRVPTPYEHVWRALGVGLRDGDGDAHLITYHPCGWHSSSQWFHEDGWLDFNMIQTWTQWSKVCPAIAADYCRMPAKPTVMAEPAYENGPEYPEGPITPLIARRQAWWAFMAGGYHTYGQDQMWRIEPGWTESFDTPGAVQMGLFRKIATSRPWWRMIPDQTVFDQGVGSGRTLNAARRAADGSCIMAYLSGQCHVRLNLGKVLTTDVRFTWVNPATGEEADAGTYATGNQVGVHPRDNTVWFGTPGHWEDAVLILDGVA